eukprot:Skav209298  [mRNA]  locus=scaffold994:74449:84331:+ [translate_table: standard]
MSHAAAACRTPQVHKQTRLCKFFAVGQCTRGSACAFAHGVLDGRQEKLRQQPDFSKTRLCADFMELGSCTAGKCKFAHGKHELRPGSAAKIGRPSTKADRWMAMDGRAQNFQLKQSLHDQAALRLMMSAGAAPSVPKSPGMVKAPKPLGCDAEQVVVLVDLPELCLRQTSFSRQTTWEGVETASAAWSRDTSLASDAGPALEPLQGSHGGSHGSAQAAASPVSPIRELPELTDVMVKNTFIEVSDSDASDAEKEFKGGLLAKSAAEPLLDCLVSLSVG